MFEQIDVVNRQARFLQELPDAGDRRLHDQLRLHPDGAVVDDTRERRYAVPIRRLLGHHDHRRGAIAQLGRIARGHLAAFPEDGRKLRQFLH